MADARSCRCVTCMAALSKPAATSASTIVRPSRAPSPSTTGGPPSRSRRTPPPSWSRAARVGAAVGPASAADEVGAGAGALGGAARETGRREDDGRDARGRPARRATSRVVVTGHLPRADDPGGPRRSYGTADRPLRTADRLRRRARQRSARLPRHRRPRPRAGRRGPPTGRPRPSRRPRRARAPRRATATRPSPGRPRPRRVPAGRRRLRRGCTAPPDGAADRGPGAEVGRAPPAEVVPDGVGVDLDGRARLVAGLPRTDAEAPRHDDAVALAQRRPPRSRASTRKAVTVYQFVSPSTHSSLTRS